MAFLIIFGVALLLTVVTFVVGELFDLGDATADSGVDVGHAPSPLSSRIIFVFATAFGGFGYIGMSLDWPVWGATVLALVGGVIVAGGTFFLVVLPMARQQGSVTVRDEDLVDLVGEVTSEIPPSGLGRVTVVAPASGARISQAARSANGARIPFGTRVRIVAAGGSVMTVAPAQQHGPYSYGAGAKEQ